MSRTGEVKEILEEYFGERGTFLLAGEMKDLNINSVEDMTESKCQQLADALLGDLFSGVISDRHYVMVRHKLYKALELKEQQGMGA